MSFRKRNAPLNSASDRDKITNQTRTGSAVAAASDELDVQILGTPKSISGVRPSPVDGRPTISTGTVSLDELLAGHAGLALGNSLLIEESGTTDYAGTLLRYYAAEGVVQGHDVHVIGLGEYWGRELPGLVEETDKKPDAIADVQGKRDKMKIAWRYERLGEIDAETAPRGVQIASIYPLSMADALVGQTSPGDGANSIVQTFCHTFDLTKRLTLPSSKAIRYIPVVLSARSNALDSVIDRLRTELSSADPKSIHRLIVPSLLSPAIYPESTSLPSSVLQFLHQLRALLRSYPTQLTAVMSLPLSLFPRTTGLTCWIELLSDGVIELIPLPHTVDAGPPLSTSTSTQEEKPQGMVRIHRLPVFHDRGGGAVGKAGVGDDLAFTLSRRKFVIKPYSLPPIEGDQDAQHGETQSGISKADIDF